MGLAVVAVVLGFIATQSAKTPSRPTGTPLRAVTRIVDGDSLYLQGIDTQIRLFGVDAPERNEPGYAEARTALRQLAKGKDLHCDQVDKDRYDRIVARCFLPDGLEINQLMIESGTADEYCRFSKGLYGAC